MSKIISKIGAHVSSAGGIDKAPQRAHEQGCETFQCFTRSPQGGPAPTLTDGLVASFKKEMKRLKMETFYIHAPYYINLASLEPRIRHSSAGIIREELERGSILGAGYVMVHVGSYKGQTLEEGIEKVIKGLHRSLDDYEGTSKLLIEISAGAGDVLGDTFQEIGAMIGVTNHQLVTEKNSGDMSPIVSLKGFGGICFDTCHAFASGYDFRTPHGIKDMLAEFDTHIGLEWLKMTHVNDSKADVGGKRDRHEHIGQGYIKEEGIASILTSDPFSTIDWILETEDEGREKDVKTLKKIRGH